MKQKNLPILGRKIISMKPDAIWHQIRILYDAVMMPK